MLGLLSNSLADHLHEEEVIMTGANYPGLSRHRAEHQGFLNRFEGLKRDLEIGKPEAVQQLFEGASTWVKDHILGEDMAAASFIRNSRAA